MSGLTGARRGFVCLAACLSASAWGTAAQRFDIDSQPLASALAAFARQSGLQLVYFSELALQQTSPPVRGVMAPETALAALLQASGLTFVLLDEKTVVIEALPPGHERLATAQDAPPSASSGQDGNGHVPRAARPLPIETVLVAARRRIEDIQGVPIAISAFTASQLQARSIENTESLNRQVTNFAVAGTNFFGRQGGSFRMRGIPGVAIYVDGVVVGGGPGSLQNVVEMERIEVLKGPQGTLFGKNAVGGAIQYVSRKPADRFGARIRTTFGSYDRLDVVADIDLPVSESLLTKFTGARLSRDGYLPSTVVARRFGSQDDTVGRFVMTWRPDAAVNLFLGGEYARQTSNGNPSTVWSLNPVCAGDPQPDNFLGSSPNNLCIYEAVGLPVLGEWAYGARKERLTASDYGGAELFTETRAMRTELNVEVADRWSVRGIAGYRQVDSIGYADFDGTPYKLFDGLNYNQRRERSLELQAIHTGRRLRGTTGLYYYGDRTWGRRMNWLANELHPAVNPLLHAAAVAYFPAFGTPGNAGPMVVDGLSRGTSEGWAAFAEWTWLASDRFSLSAGARYNHDRMTTAAYPVSDPLDLGCCRPSLNLRPGGPAIPNQSGSATFTELSPRVSLQYQWTPSIMGYFTYSEGFGAGGFTGGNIPDQPAGGFRSFGPERLGNYEFGLRSDLLDSRLRFNVSAFFGRYRDIQVAEEVIPRFPTTTNAGAARIRGIEIEGAWSPVRALALSYGVGLLDTAYTDIGRATNIRLDSPFAYAPRRSFTLGAQYQWQLSRGGQLSWRGDYGWQDAVAATLDVNTGSTIPAYGLLASRLTYRSVSGRWELALSGTNLTDEYYRINGFFIPADQMDNGTLGRPREWALTLGVVFE